MRGFQPDTPIEDVSGDKLNWGRYAGLLANGIKNADVSRASVVIGLQGDWGSGKSSLKNLVLQRLRLDGWDEEHILEFDPWLIQSAEQIAERFFIELAERVGKVCTGDAKEFKKDLLRNSRITGGIKRSLDWLAVILKLVPDETARKVGEVTEALKKSAEPALTATEEFYKSAAEIIEDD